MRNLDDLTATFAAPALQLVMQEAASRSHFGGDPNLPAGLSWPQWRGEPLDFLARISLDEVQRALPMPWLPASGALLFFYATIEQPWGFDPQDDGSCAVLHVPDLDRPVSNEVEAAEDAFLPRRCVGFRSVQTRPSLENELIAALDLTDEEREAYQSLLDAPFQGRPKHQLGGRPVIVQNDTMELECQLASNGLYCGDASGYEDPRAQALQAGAAQWRLLFQFDTDDDLGVMWGDCGLVYFWVREAQPGKADFSRPWLVLQCG